MVLYYSFDMLNIEFEMPSGKALLEGQVAHNRVSKDRQIAITESVDEATKERACLVHGEFSEAPISSEKRLSTEFLFATNMQTREFVLEASKENACLVVGEPTKTFS